MGFNNDFVGKQTMESNPHLESCIGFILIKDLTGLTLLTLDDDFLLLLAAAVIASLHFPF